MLSFFERNCGPFLSRVALTYFRFRVLCPSLFLSFLLLSLPPFSAFLSFLLSFFHVYLAVMASQGQTTHKRWAPSLFLSCSFQVCLRCVSKWPPFENCSLKPASSSACKTVVCNWMGVEDRSGRQWRAVWGWSPHFGDLGGNVSTHTTAQVSRGDLGPSVLQSVCRQWCSRKSPHLLYPQSQFELRLHGLRCSFPLSSPRAMSCNLRLQKSRSLGLKNFMNGAHFWYHVLSSLGCLLLPGLDSVFLKFLLCSPGWPRTHCVAQVILQHRLLQPLLLECWDYRWVQEYLAGWGSFTNQDLNVHSWLFSQDSNLQ